MGEWPSRGGAKPNITWTIKMKSDRLARGQTYFNLLSAFQAAEAAVTHPIPMDATGRDAIRVSPFITADLLRNSSLSRTTCWWFRSKNAFCSHTFTYYIQFIYYLYLYLHFCCSRIISP